MPKKLWLEELRRTAVLDPITSDRRSADGTRLGRHSDWIFKNAIKGGQADFDQQLDDLSPRDRVMLYALFNQKAHIDEMVHAFEKLIPAGDDITDPVIVDVGCGPFTAGLALANVIGNAASFRYFGVDRAETMCTVARELADKVRGLGEFHPETEFSFYDSIDQIDFGPRRATQTTLFILSYLLASDTIDVPTLVSQIIHARARASLGPAVVLYTNSARDSARASFPKFRDRLMRAGFELNVEEIEHFTDTEKPRDIHYALFVQPAISTMPITDF